MQISGIVTVYVGLLLLFSGLWRYIDQCVGVVVRDKKNPVSWSANLSNPVAADETKLKKWLFYISQGKMATFYMWGKQIYNFLFWSFIRIQLTKNY